MKPTSDGAGGCARRAAKGSQKSEGSSNRHSAAVARSRVSQWADAACRRTLRRRCLLCASRSNHWLGVRIIGMSLVRPDESTWEIEDPSSSTAVDAEGNGGMNLVLYLDKVICGQLWLPYIRFCCDTSSLRRSRRTNHPRGTSSTGLAS
eukprot:scaffold1421_cov255-Pinguiococcus_pyrenoidosus.AAC.10